MLEEGTIEVLPKHDTGTGNKFILGSQMTQSAVEMGYCKSDHQGYWAGIPFNSQYSSLNFDAKHFFGNNTLRILGLLGLGFSDVTVKDGSSGGFTTVDAKFHALVIRFGAGLEIMPLNNIAIDIQVIRRWGYYDSVDGVTSGDINDDVSADGMTTSLEIKYLFK